MRKYEHAPSSQFVKKRLQSKGKKYEIMTKEILSELEKSTSENRAENYKKSKKIRKSWWCLILGLISLTVFAALFVGSHILRQDGQTPIEGNVTFAEGIVQEIFPDIDEATLSVLFPDFGEDPAGEIEPLTDASSIRPDTNNPWVRIRHQWNHDDLNVFIIVNSSKNETGILATKVIQNWSDLLKTNSHNSSAWNFNILNVTQENIRRGIPSANIVVILEDQPNQEKCQDSYGYAEKQDENRRYSFVYTSCGKYDHSLQNIETALYHEVAHSLGLGHAYNQHKDLMCGRDIEINNRLTCSALPDHPAVPSMLDINALLYSYGTDGFGGMNRELQSRPYYLSDAKGDGAVAATNMNTTSATTAGENQSISEVGGVGGTAAAQNNMTTPKNETTGGNTTEDVTIGSGAGGAGAAGGIMPGEDTGIHNSTNL
jgi:hypothetical protein